MTLPGAFGKREVTMCLVRTYCGHTSAIQTQTEERGMEVGGGMGLRKGIKRENGPKLSAVALHVMKACIV